MIKTTPRPSGEDPYLQGFLAGGSFFGVAK